MRTEPRRLGLSGAGLALVAALVAVPAAAQMPEFEEFHTWTDVATIYNFSEKFRYDGDYGLRGVLTDDDWTLLYIRPSVRYDAKPWLKLHGGAALFYNFFTGEDLPEIRPWGGLRLVARPGRWTVSNYFRLEYRAFYLKSRSEWEASFRGRWQLQANSPRFAIGSIEDFFVLASIEPFFEIGSTLDGTFGDRYRINFGLGRRMNDRLRIELNYLFHKIRVEAAGGSLDLDDHVVRLRFFHRFGKS